MSVTKIGSISHNYPLAVRADLLRRDRAARRYLDVLVKTVPLRRLSSFMVPETRVVDLLDSNKVLVGPYVDRLGKICAKVENEEGRRLIYWAFDLAWRWHTGIFRDNKITPYFEHAMLVAEMATEFELGHEAIAAALIHDVPEDPNKEGQRLSVKELKAQLNEAGFGRSGQKVLGIVSGLIKVGKEAGTTFVGKPSQAVIFAKLLKHGVVYPEALMIKLFDRLHNMMTLDDLEETKVKRGADHKTITEKRQKIAAETLYVYAPIARAFGMLLLCRQLEDLAFPYVRPEDFEEIEYERSVAVSSTKQAAETMVGMLRNTLINAGVVNAEVSLVKRDIYELYLRVTELDIKLKAGEKLSATDVYNVRIKVPAEAECYRAFRAVTGRYPLLQRSYLPREFTSVDHIAKPMPNGQQLLRFYVSSVDGIGDMAVVIRDQRMFREFCIGISTARKELRYSLLPFFRSLLMELGEDLAERDLAPAELYERVGKYMKFVMVYTPGGEVINLPVGATVLDFACAIHDEVFLRAVSAEKLVDDEWQPVDNLLGAVTFGQSIRINKDPKNRIVAQSEWLPFLKTDGARQTLRKYLKGLPLDELKKIGLRALHRAGMKFYVGAEDLIRTGFFTHYLKKIAGGVEPNEYLLEIGRGTRNADKEVERMDQFYRARFKKCKLRKVAYYVAVEIKDQTGLLQAIGASFKHLGLNLNDVVVANVPETDRLILAVAPNVFGVLHGGVVVGGGVLGKVQRIQAKTIIKLACMELGIGKNVGVRVLPRREVKELLLLKLASLENGGNRLK